MTVEDIKEYCREAFEKASYDFDYFGIEVSINGRLTRTLGRCLYKRDIITNDIIPTKIEISKQLLETSTLDDIISIIYHECCHALVTIETGEKHGHDAVFKAMCKKVGTKNDTCATKVKRTIEEDKIYKYCVFCKKDGFVAGYSKMCPTLKNLSSCICNKCGKSNLYYKQNW